MPQIRESDQAAFIAFAQDKGVTVTHETVAIHSIQPAQTSYNPVQVAQMPVAIARSKPIMVSADGYILDGTNRWARLMHEDGLQSVSVIRVGAMGREALALMKSFPKATSKDISQVGRTKETA
jgi:hypothetical protein